MLTDIVLWNHHLCLYWSQQQLRHPAHPRIRQLRLHIRRSLRCAKVWSSYGSHGWRCLDDDVFLVS
jgi:hypothetical protein